MHYVTTFVKSRGWVYMFNWLFLWCILLVMQLCEHSCDSECHNWCFVHTMWNLVHVWGGVVFSHMLQLSYDDHLLSSAMKPRDVQHFISWPRSTRVLVTVRRQWAATRVSWQRTMLATHQMPGLLLNCCWKLLSTCYTRRLSQKMPGRWLANSVQYLCLGFANFEDTLARTAQEFIFACV